MSETESAPKVFKIDRKAIAERKGRKVASTTTLAESGLSALANDDRLPRYIRRLFLLLYGPPGSAKTVIAHTLPNTRTLDLDNGMQSVEWAIKTGVIKKSLDEIVYKTIIPDPSDFRADTVIDDMTDTLDEWLADEDIPPENWHGAYPQFWDTLIIDSASVFNDAAIIKALHENSRLGLSKSLEKLSSKVGVTPMRQQDWGAAGSIFMKVVNQARSVGKNVVLICHEYVERSDSEDGGSGVVLGIEPLLIGQLRQKIPGAFDEVWYAHVKGPRTKPEFLLQTTPDQIHRLRSRLGCLDPVEKADFNAIKAKIAKFYGVPESKLWVGAHGAAEREEAIKEDAEESGGV
jgi:hypothetical protein